MTEEENQQTTTFASYGKSFQEKIMQALLTDQKWAEQMLEVFDVDYFDLKYLNFLADRYFAYARKYKVFPTMQLLLTIVREELMKVKGADKLLAGQVVDYVKRVRSNPNPGDLDYVKEKALDFCRKQALMGALEAAVDHMKTEKYEQCVEVVKKAVMVGTTPSVGHEFFLDHEARFTELQRTAVPTGIPELDRKEILNGGLGKGELGVIVAPTGVGKSHMLVNLGCAALKEGYDVVHYTLELSETAVGVRYDSNICDVDSTHVIENKDLILEKYKDMKGLGRLFIKHYPMNAANIYTIKSHIERLSVTKGFKPGLICLDYADILRSTRQFDSLRHELKLVYEELRSFADEVGVPIWTASQSNKEGSNADVVDLSNMSEAYGKAMVADVVVSISRKPYEKANGSGRIFVAKNRAGRDGIVYPVHIDTARSKFEVTGNSSSALEESFSDEQKMKDQVRAKWREVKKDPELPDRKLEAAPTADGSKESV
jgi:replicative DNA helicase